jgi:hypothetical protein
MFTAYLRTPPSGHQKVSQEQLHNADLGLFRFPMRRDTKSYQAYRRQ